MDTFIAFLIAFVIVCFYLVAELSCLLWVINVTFDTNLILTGDKYFAYCVLRMIQAIGIMTILRINKHV